MNGEFEKNKGCKPYLITSVFLMILLVSMLLAVCIGKYTVTPFESLNILFGLGDEASEMTRNVVMSLRVPRILASVLVGAALSVSGAVYQGVFRNPLVSPDYLGISSGASIGAAVGILMSLSTALISAYSFAGGVIAMLLTMSIPMLLRNNSNIMLVLSGVIVSSLMSSVLGFIKYLADPDTQLASIVYWTMGSFAYVTLHEFFIILPIILVPTVILMLISWWIDILSMGENEAKVLGANVNLVRTIALCSATLMTSSAVCLAGNIGWVGLVIPHFARLLIGPGSRRLFPLTAILGGFFMLLVDSFTRIIGVTEMPVSILTGVIGVPFYCWLLYRQRKALL